MVTPMLGVKLLSVYEVKIISEGDSDVYENYFLTGNHIAPLTLGYFRISGPGEKAMTSYK